MTQEEFERMRAEQEGRPYTPPSRQMAGLRAYLQEQADAGKAVQVATGHRVHGTGAEGGDHIGSPTGLRLLEPRESAPDELVFVTEETVALRGLEFTEVEPGLVHVLHPDQGRHGKSEWLRVRFRDSGAAWVRRERYEDAGEARAHTYLVERRGGVWAVCGCQARRLCIHRMAAQAVEALRERRRRPERMAA
jgi:hypothetical protein